MCRASRAVNKLIRDSHSERLTSLFCDKSIVVKIVISFCVLLITEVNTD